MASIASAQAKLYKLGHVSNGEQKTISVYEQWKYMMNESEANYKMIFFSR